MKTPKYRPIPVEALKERLEYKEGALYWKRNVGQRARKGKKAGYINNTGYWQIRINGTDYLEHRLIWAYFNGDEQSYIDHIDGDPLNNSIENLRIVTPLESAYNSKTRKDNTSGARNVYWNPDKKYWYVVINVEGKRKYIGSFQKDFELAELVAEEARRRYHGEYASFR